MHPTANLALAVLLDLPESQDPKDHLASPEFLPLQRPLCPENLERPETKEPQGHLVLLERLVPMDPQVLPGQRASLAQTEHLEPMANPARLVPLDRAAPPERREFAPSIVPSTAESSSRTALGAKQQFGSSAKLLPSSNIKNNIFVVLAASAAAVLLLLPPLFCHCRSSPSPSICCALLPHLLIVWPKSSQI